MSQLSFSVHQELAHSAPELPSAAPATQLAARIRRRDPSTLAAVVEAHLDSVLRAARAAGLDSQQAEDVAQETFATFLETATRFEGRSQVKTWIFGILYHKLKEARRSFAKDRRSDNIDRVFESHFDTDGSWSRPARGPEGDLLAGEARRNIARCLGEAPDRQRRAFVLREVEGLSSKAICKILEVSKTNLGVMLHRVRARLRECLESEPRSL